MNRLIPPKTLRMLIRKGWLVDSITGLGSGYSIHLAYQDSEIDPQVIDDIRSDKFSEAMLGEIICIGEQPNRLVASVEILKANDFKTFIRFDMRLLEVKSFRRELITREETPYLCYYERNPA